jgi:hypothetical protein
MKWKLVLLLSLFGLAMAFATVSLIHVNTELICWLVIFIVSAYLIAKNCIDRYFLHGLLVGLLNCVWITAIHVFYFHTYMAHHIRMARKIADMTIANHPMRMMALMGIGFGIVLALILGLLSFSVSRLVKKKGA